jgi:hypothetical protein
MAVEQTVARKVIWRGRLTDGSKVGRGTQAYNAEAVMTGLPDFNEGHNIEFYTFVFTYFSPPSLPSFLLTLFFSCEHLFYTQIKGSYPK